MIYISNKSKYLNTDVRYATAVKTNLYNFKSSFISSRHPEIVKMPKTGIVYRTDGVEITLGTENYFFSLFCMTNYFV